MGILDWDAGATAVRAERFRKDFPGWYMVFAIPAPGLSAGDVAAALAAGADGVIAQDLTGLRLTSQLRLLLRRSSAQRRDCGAVSSAGDIRLHARSCEVSFRRRGRWSPGRGLTRKEAALLSVFLGHPGRVLERGTLLETVWGEAAGRVNGEALDKQVAGLRRKLGAHGRRLRTVRGRGYRMI
jgi:DNA-binding response OmpR family regulator